MNSTRKTCYLAALAALGGLSIASGARAFTAPSAGQMAIWVNVATGDVTLVGNGTVFEGYGATSGGKNIVSANFLKPMNTLDSWNVLSSTGGYIAEGKTTSQSTVTINSTGSQSAGATTGPVDLGDVFNTTANAQDLSFHWLNGSGGYELGSIQYSAATLVTLTWDPSGTHTASDASGNWDTSTSNWATGSGDTTWVNGDVASFGNKGTSPVTVTIDQAGLTAAGITFNAMGTGGYYTIASGGAGDNLTLGGTITMNANATISAPIVGTGALTIAGPDTLILSGTNSYTGGTTLAGGIVSISNANNLGTGGISFNGGTLLTTADITDGAAVTLGTSGGTISDGGNTDTFSGVFSGAGSLTKAGAGTLTLSAANTWTGTTTITAGTLEFTGDTSGLTGNVADNSALSFNQAANSSLSGVISGTGSVTEDGAAGTTLTLSAANTWTGTTTITAGTLEFTGDTSGLTGNVADNSALSFTQAANSSLSGVISGTGSVTEDGAAGTTLTLSGANTYIGGTIVSGGTLAISSDSNLGSAAGAVTLTGGTLNYTGSGGTLANAINATGTTSILENSGSGTETLTGALTNTTAGNTLAFSGGTFNLNETGSGSGTFQIGDAPSTVIVSNPNAFGSGAILLTGGATPALSSTLETSFALAQSGATMTINAGSYTQQVNSTLALLVASSSTTLGSSVNDSINLGTGAAKLNGTLDLVFAATNSGGPNKKDVYQVITTTGTISGNFSSVVLSGPGLSGAPASLRGIATLSGTDEIVTLETQYFSDPNLSNFSPNELAVANYLNTYAIGIDPSSPLGIALNNIASDPSLKDQAAFLDQSTPQAYGFLADEAFQNSTFLSQEVFNQLEQVFENGGFNTSGLTMLKTSDQDPFTVSMDAAMASAQQQAQNSAAYLDAVTRPGVGPVTMPGVGPDVPAHESPYSCFSGFVLGTITVDQLSENSGYPSQHFTTGSVLAGLDYRLNRNLVVGALFNWGYTGGTMDSYASRSQSSSYTPGIFASWQKAGFYANALMSYTYNTYKINRNVSSTVATGEPDANQYDAAVLAGYYFPVAPGLKIGPAAGVGFTQMNVGGFNETGSPFDLSVSKQHADSLRSLLGAQGQYAFHISRMPLPISINFNALWQHEFLDSSRGITASFTQLGGSFLYTTPGPSRDAALLGLGASGYLTKDVSLFVNYETQVGNKNQFAQTVMAGAAVNF